MRLSPGHFLAPLVLLLFLICIYFLLDVIFIQTYASESKAFDADLRKIENALYQDDLDEVVLRSDELLVKTGDGVNEIRTQCFKGIARARQGRRSESMAIFDHLHTKYYGIRSVYTQRPEDEKQLDVVFSSILSTYVPAVIKATSNPVSLRSLIAALTWKRLMMIGGLVIASVVLYDRFYQRRVLQNKNGR